jgi:hypothetical protein
METIGDPEKSDGLEDTSAVIFLPVLIKKGIYKTVTMKISQAPFEKPESQLSRLFSLPDREPGTSIVAFYNNVSEICFMVRLSDRNTMLNLK